MFTVMDYLECFMVWDFLVLLPVLRFRAYSLFPYFTSCVIFFSFILKVPASCVSLMIPPLVHFYSL